MKRLQRKVREKDDFVGAVAEKKVKPVVGSAALPKVGDGVVSSPSTGVVTVACKLPNGIILRVFDMVDTVEVIPGGMRTIQRAQPKPEQVLVHGIAVPFGQAPKCRMAFGYALTENVNAEFAALWFKQNADSDMVRNKMIFAFEKASDIEAFAKEHQKVRSGLEPLDPENMPPEFKKIKKFEKDA